MRSRRLNGQASARKKQADARKGSPAPLISGSVMTLQGPPMPSLLGGHDCQSSSFTYRNPREPCERKAAPRSRTEAHIVRRIVRTQAGAVFPAKPPHPISVFSTWSFVLPDLQQFVLFLLPGRRRSTDDREITAAPIWSSCGAGVVPHVDFPVDFFPGER